MKYIYLPIGFLSLALGVAGIFLPVLPTTPFLLLSAALFFRSSPRAYQWLLNHKLLGPYIALSLLWLTSLHCIFLMFDALWLKAMMLAVAVGVTLYLCSLKTKRND